MQWVWDVLGQMSQPISVAGMQINRTTRGVLIKPRTVQQIGGGGMNWRGEFSAGAAYAVGDLVRVSTTPTGHVGDGNNYTGVWLCVTAGTGHQPVYPEPVAAYWVLLSLGVREMNVTDSVTGSKRQLVGASDAYV